MLGHAAGRLLLLRRVGAAWASICGNDAVATGVLLCCTFVAAAAVRAQLTIVSMSCAIMSLQAVAPPPVKFRCYMHTTQRFRLCACPPAPHLAFFCASAAACACLKSFMWWKKGVSSVNRKLRSSTLDISLRQGGGGRVRGLHGAEVGPASATASARRLSTKHEQPPGGSNPLPALLHAPRPPT